MTFETLIGLINILGLVAFSISGVIDARRKRLDLVGVLVVSFVTTFGGGTLRDLLLGRLPLAWVVDQRYLLGTFAIALIAFYVLREWNFPRHWLEIPDALGLGLYAVTGTTFALQMNLPPLVASVMGVITATFGGVIRDVICNELPTVFQRGQLYATAAFVGAWTYLILEWAQAADTVAVAGGIVITFTIRMLALRFDIRLPDR